MFGQATNQSQSKGIEQRGYNMKRLNLLFLSMATALVTASSIEAQLKDFSEAPAYKVLRVIDGDTVELQSDKGPFKVRLMGVDTPETVHPSKPVEPYGKEASRFLKNLLRGESVYLEYSQSREDKYGRTLAYLYRAPGGLFVNAEIVRQGYGHAYTQYPFKYQELFGKYETRAEEAEKGLWSVSQVAPAGFLPAPPPAKEVTRPAVRPVGKTVFVTRTGKKYHAAGCRYLKRRKISIPLDQAKSTYTACSVCHP